MGPTFIWGSRCPGSGLLRKCPRLKNRDMRHLGLWLLDEQGAGFNVFADEGDCGFERRSRSEDGRDAVLS